MVGIGLIGFGYWGPNLARNFARLKDCRLVAICEKNSARAQEAARLFPEAEVTDDAARLLENKDVQAIVIATPVAHHYDLTRRALLAGKDVLVEKPFTQTVEQAEELCALAKDLGRIVAVDHTFLYTGAVRKIKELVEDGALGALLYFDSVRVNLGLFQEDVNVIHDLAPHDLAILNHITPQRPTSVVALGSCHAHKSIESLAYLHLGYEGDFVAHFHFSWLAPVKVRKTLVAGTSKMIVYDDLEPSDKVKIYDKGIMLAQEEEALNRIKVEYRTGDMWAPQLSNREALNLMAEEFATSVRTRSKPLVDAQEGLAVVRILEAAYASLRDNGQRKEIKWP
jgi:predicted dehydrogenase